MMKKIALALLLAFTLLPCGLFCAGYDPHWPTAARARRGGPATGAWLCVDRRLSSLGRWPYVWVPAAGSVHPMKASAGSRTGGSTTVIIMRCRKDTGGKLQFQPTKKAGRLPRFSCHGQPKEVGPTASALMNSQTSHASE